MYCYICKATFPFREHKHFNYTRDDYLEVRSFDKKFIRYMRRKKGIYRQLTSSASRFLLTTFYGRRISLFCYKVGCRFPRGTLVYIYRLQHTTTKNERRGGVHARVLEQQSNLDSFILFQVCLISAIWLHYIFPQQSEESCVHIDGAHGASTGFVDLVEKSILLFIVIYTFNQKIESPSVAKQCLTNISSLK